jgi:DNA-binding response OmpR family regulator|tara:strand:- start:1342 stop:2286 length:945 start_codon:yes stop_codon:yes gene_type:complete
MKILAVDDDNAVRISLNVMFRKWNDIELEVAEDANNALEKLATTEYLMMFCDIDMPGMNGLELLKIVKEKYPLMPVVMLTGNQDIKAPIQAFRDGAMDYLQKPMQTASVRETIDNAVKFVEEETKKDIDVIELDDFKKIVENFSLEKAGLNDSGSKTAEFSKLARILQEKLIHPSKRGRIHNLFLLTKSGIVISNLSTSNVNENDSDIMGGMFTAVKDFMEDAVSSGNGESLNDITFGEFHIKFASGAYSDMAVVYLGQLGQDAEDAVTDALIAFELENMAVLEDWNGDQSLLKNSDQHLEDLFEKIDKSETND